jgi:hypothetical protein
MEVALGIASKCVAVFAVHEDVTARLEFVENPEFDVNGGRTRAASGSKWHVIAVGFQSPYYFLESLRCRDRRHPSMLTSTDVLELATVTLDTCEVQLGVSEDALDDAQGSVPIDDARSAEPNVNVAQNLE